MLRFLLAVTLMAVPYPSLSRAQSYPAYLFPTNRWDVTVDGSNMDDFTGLGVDAQGNTYLAGSTFAPNYVVKDAEQAHSASAGPQRRSLAFGCRRSQLSTSCREEFP